jgi:hypothetical protein
MKKQLNQSIKVVLIFALFLSTTFNVFAEGNYTCKLKNITQTNANTLVFDLWMEWTGNAPEQQFHSLQAGINFDYNAIVNGGQLTGSYVSGSSFSGFASSQKNYSCKIDENSHQFRIAAAFTNASNAVTITRGNGIKIGTFKITNTVPFTANSRPNFSWSFQLVGNTTTRTMVSTYNQSKLGKDITVNAQHIVEGNPELNPAVIGTPLSDNIVKNNAKAIVSASINENNISVYPNPTSDVINIDVTGTEAQNTTVKVLDINSRLINQTLVRTHEGVNTITIPVKELAAGTYLVQVSKNDELIFTGKVQKK